MVTYALIAVLLVCVIILLYYVKLSRQLRADIDALSVSFDAYRATYNYRTFVARLLSDRDVLGDIAKFVYWRERDRASVDDGYNVALSLLEEMESAWGLRQLGGIGEVVRYDPDKHVAGSPVSLRRGADVVIIEPGWRIGDAIVRRPVVRSVTTGAR